MKVELFNKKLENKDIDKIISMIEMSFVWKGTKQGQKYWEKVRENLKQVRTEKETSFERHINSLK